MNVSTPSKSRLNKKLIISGLATTLIVISGMIWWFLAERTIRAKTETLATQATETKQLLDKVTASNEKVDRTARVAALKTLAAKKTSEETCTSEWWYGWQQQLSDSLERTNDDCKRKVATINQMVQEAHVATEFLDQERQVITVLSSLQIDKSKKDWQQRAANAAKEAVTDLSRLTDTSAAKLVHAEAKKRVGVIDKGWQTLLHASKKQDGTAYENASDTLDQAYADLAAIADVSDQEIIRLISSLKTST